MNFFLNQTVQIVNNHCKISQVTVTFIIGLFGVVVNVLAMIVFLSPTAMEKVGDSLRISMFWLSFCDFFTLISKVKRDLLVTLSRANGQGQQ